MAYKRYIKKNGKIYGPYEYHSQRENGKVVSKYVNKDSKASLDLGSSKRLSFPSVLIFLGIILSIILLSFAVSNSSIESSVTGKVVSEGVESSSFFSKMGRFITGLSVENSSDELVVKESNSTEEILENETEIVFEINGSANQNETFVAESNESVDNNETGFNESVVLNETRVDDVVSVEVSETDEVLNVSSSASVVEEETIQYGAVLGRPVKWKKVVRLNESSNNLTVQIPKEAEKITVSKVSNLSQSKTGSVKITGNFVSENYNSNSRFLNFLKRLFSSITGRVIGVEESEEVLEVEINEEDITEVEIEYETPAPVAFESNQSYGKEVIISSEYHYENILAFSELPSEVLRDEIKLYHFIDGAKVPVDFVAYDSEGNVVEASDSSDEGVKIELEEILNSAEEEDENETVLYGEEYNSSASNYTIKDVVRNTPVLNEDLVSYIEWVVPHLSNQTYLIVINAISAEHLDENREFISDIYSDIEFQDGTWSEVISDSHYVRVEFETPLENFNDITVYARSENVSSIEIYLEGEEDLIATIGDISDEGLYKAYLTNLSGSYSTFDLRVVGSSLEFDYIVDPIEINFSDTISSNSTSDEEFYHLELNRDGEGYAYFNGSNRIIVDKDNFEFFNGTSLTVSLWIKSNTDNDGVPLSAWAPGSVQAGFGLYTSELWYMGDASSWVTVDSGLSFDDEWHNYVLVYNGSYMTSYKDGVVVDDSIASGSFNASYSAENYFTLGRDNRVNSRYFIGSVDEVMVFNRELDSSEISNIYSLNRLDYNGSSNSLVANWVFDDTRDTEDFYGDNDGSFVNGNFVFLDKSYSYSQGFGMRLYMPFDVPENQSLGNEVSVSKDFSTGWTGAGAGGFDETGELYFTTDAVQSGGLSTSNFLTLNQTYIFRAEGTATSEWEFRDGSNLVYSVIPTGDFDVEVKFKASNDDIRFILDEIGYLNFTYFTIKPIVSYDYTNENNDGDIYGNITWDNSGYIGGAYDFDGVDDYIQISSFDEIDNSEEFTISMWINPDSLVQDRYYFELGSVTNRISLLSGLSAVSGSDQNDLIFIVANSANTYGYTTNSLIQDGVWSYVTLTFNGSGSTNADKLKIYINNVSQSLTFSGTIPSVAPITDDVLLFGAQTTSSAKPYNGTMDEVIIFDRALNSTEVSEIYSNQFERFYPEGTLTFPSQVIGTGNNTINFSISGIQEYNSTNVQARAGYWDISKGYNTTDEGLVGYWTMDYYNSTGIFDNSSFDNFATFYNADNSDLTLGVWNNSFDTGSGTKYINVSSNSNIVFSTGSNLTISAWFKDSQTNGARSIVSKFDSTAPYEGYAVTLDPGYNCGTTDEIGFWVGDNTGRYLCTSNSYNDGEWHHVVANLKMINSTTGNASIYVDGELVVSGLRNPDFSEEDGNPLNIGANSLSPTSRIIGGAIDDVMIFNRSLSESEMKDLHFKGMANYSYSDWADYLGGVNLTINTDTTNILPEFRLLSDSNNFYSPLVYGNLTFDNFYTDTISPTIEFNSPTLDDGFIIGNNDVIINTTISDNSETSAWIDWNKSLLGYFSFDSTNSTGVLDNSSYSNYALFEGASFGESNLTVGLRGNSLDFDGVDDYVDLPFAVNYNYTTISAWFKTNTTSSQYIVDARDGSLDGLYLIVSSGIISSRFNDCNIAGSTVASDNEWHYAVVTRNESDVMIYLDGVLDGNGLCGTDISVTNNANIGSRAFVAPAFTWNGSLDEVMIFSRGLSSDEILALYNNSAYRLNATIPNQVDGTYNYSIYAIDAAGNLNITTDRQVTIDTEKPFINFTTGTEDNGSILSRDYAYVNVSSSGAENGSVFLDWNNSLVGWWRIDDYNSTGIYDNSSNDNFGIFNGGIGEQNLVSGKRGYGIEFDGVDDYIQTTASLSEATYFTISAWYYHENDADRVGIGQGTTATARLKLLHSTDNYVYAVVSDSGSSNYGRFLDSSSSGSWNHYAMVFNGSGSNDVERLQVYKNGVNQTLSYIGGIPSKVDTLSGNLYVGADTGASLFYSNGSIDDVMIFNRSLSESEILSIYNTTAYEYNFTSLANGDYSFKAYSQDTAGNFNSTDTRIVTINLDSTAPMINVYSPTNISYNVTNLIYVNATADESIDTWIVDYNGTNYTLSDINTTFEFVGGLHNLKLWANDSADNFGLNDSIWFYVDDVEPLVEVVSPTATTYASSSVSLEVRTDENSTCEYSLDAGVTNFSLTSNSTGTGHTASRTLSNGGYVLNYYCSDLIGNYNTTQNVSFTVSVTTGTTTTTSSGGGGGGGGASTTTPEFSFSVPENYEDLVVINDIQFDVFTIENTGSLTEEYTFSTENLDEIISFTEEKVSVLSGQEAKVEFKVSSPREAGVYTGKIIVTSGSLRKEILITLNVRTEKTLFDITLSSPKSMKVFKVGNNFATQISLLEMGLQEKIDVTLNYEIKDFSGNVHLVESETIAVLDQKEFNKEFYTEDLPPGDYVLAVELVYPDGVAVASSQFKIKSKVGLETDKIVMGSILVGLLFVTGLIIYAIKRYKRIGKHVK